MGCAIKVAKRFDRNKEPLLLVLVLLVLLLVGPPVPMTMPPSRLGPPGPIPPDVPPGMLVDILKLLPEVPPLGWNSWILNLSSPLSRK